MSSAAFAAFPTGWGRKCAVTIDHTKVSADVSNYPAGFNLSNFPSEMFDSDGSYPALNGGGDIRFSSDSAGVTQLPCEIVSFVTNADPSSGSAEIYVKIPAVSSSSDTVIYVWYNKSGETQPAASDTYGSQNVWDSDYKAVYHMNGAAYSNIADSTSNANNVVGENGSPDYNQAGIFSGGKSVNFESSSVEYLGINYSSGLGDTNDFTIEAWYKAQNATIATYEGVFCKYHSSSGGWVFLRYSDEKQSFYTNEPGGSGVDECKSSSAYDDTNWHYLAGVIDSSGNKVLYVDGASAGTGGPVGVANYTGGIRIGATYVNSTNFTADGYIDEVRYSSTRRTSDWITTEYNNLSSPSTFASAGTPETPSAGGGWTHTICGVSAANMSKVNGVAKANISKINQT